MSVQRTLVQLSALLFVFCFTAEPLVAADSSTLHLQIVLVWASNGQKPSDKNAKELEPDLTKRLRKTPYKWKDYYEVRRKAVSVTANNIEKLPMSSRCSLEIKNSGSERVEVKLIGEGKPVSRQVESLPRGHIMVIAGDDKNDTAWLILLRQQK